MLQNIHHFELKCKFEIVTCCYQCVLLFQFFVHYSCCSLIMCLCVTNSTMESTTTTPLFITWILCLILKKTWIWSQTKIINGSQELSTLKVDASWGFSFQSCWQIKMWYPFHHFLDSWGFFTLIGFSIPMNVFYF